MIKTYKFLVCLFISVVPVCARAQCAATDVCIQAVDKDTQKSVAKLIVETNVIDPGTGKKYTATTNTSGIATFPGLCNRKRTSNISEIQYTIKDPDHYYQTIKFKIKACEGRMSIPKMSKAQEQKYASPELVKKYAVDRSYNLKFYPVCNPQFKNYPANVKKHCVYDFFKKTNVQMNEAIKLAELYAVTKYSDISKIICKGSEYTIRNGLYYLQCTSADAKHVFEFHFGNLKAGNQQITVRDMGALIPTGVYDVQANTADGICRINDGNFSFQDGRYTSTRMAHICTKNPPQNIKPFCTQLDSDAQQFGWNVDIFDSSSCKFDFNTVMASDDPDDLSDLPDIIDPYIFANISVYSNSDLILLLNQYVRYKMSEYNDYVRITDFTCSAGFNRYSEGSWSDKHIIPCVLETNDGHKYNLKFVFKNVNASNDTAANGGKAGMACMASGGNFDGVNCTTVGRAQCIALATTLPGGTRWDKKMGTCLMNDAKTLENAKDGQKLIKVTGGAVVGIVLTIATGGTAAAIVASVVSAAAAETSFVLNDKLNDRIRDIIAASTMCPSSTDCSQKLDCKVNCNPNSICAKNVFLDLEAETDHFAYDPTNSDNDSLSQAASYAYQNLTEKISWHCIDEAFREDFNKRSSKLKTAIRIVDAVGMVAGFVDGKGVKSLWQLGKAAKGAKSLTVLVKSEATLNFFKVLISKVDPSKLGNVHAIGSALENHNEIKSLENYHYK